MPVYWLFFPLSAPKGVALAPARAWAVALVLQPAQRLQVAQQRVLGWILALPAGAAMPAAALPAQQAAARQV